MDSPGQRQVEILQTEGYLRNGCVYYAGVGDLIKIGFTTQLRTRMWALRPDVLLAAEPGEPRLERRRHDQFEHLRVPGHGELFGIADELLRHVDQLSQLFLVPPIGERKYDGRGNRKPRSKPSPFYNH